MNPRTVAAAHLSASPAARRAQSSAGVVRAATLATAPTAAATAVAAPTVRIAVATTGATANAAAAVKAAAAVTLKTVYIDPTAAAGGDGSQARPLNNWSFALQPGAQYLQRAGTVFTGVIHVETAASAAAPVVLGSYGTGAPPAIVGTVDLNGASYVRVAGFQMTNASGAAIVIQNGSSHVEVAGNIIANARQGIWIGNNAGGDVSVHDNVVMGSTGAGILVDSTTAAAGHETLIAGNLITGSGADGIELTASRTIVSGNTVTNNGLAIPATSGIHVYTASAAAQTGQYETITGNIVAYSHDAWMQDGNGILLDQWTSHDTVSNNFLLGNDGAGIALYDSSYDTVSNNLSAANGVDSGHSHSILAELVVNEALGLTANNSITGNTLLAFLPAGFAAFVDDQAATAHNSFSNNVLENLSGASIYQVASLRGASLATWNGTLGAHDRFSAVSLTAPVAGAGYGYSFAAGTTLALTGQTAHLAGWSATGGLFGT